MEDYNEKALSLVSDVSYSLCPIIFFAKENVFTSQLKCLPELLLLLLPE